MTIKALAAAYAAGDDGYRSEFNVTRVCDDNGVSRQTFYNYVARVKAGGIEGLEPRSRAPLTIPGRTPVDLEDEIVRIRKDLAGDGLDHGALTIRWHLMKDQRWRVPATSTIHAVLVRRGQVTPQPKKRPKGSYTRFEAGQPNEMWQIDHTDWELVDGTEVKIFNIIDDHSRVLIASTAVRHATTQEAWRAFSIGARRWGMPSRVLSDNGLCFSGKLRHLEVFFEARLRDVGVKPITGRIYHPQTTGKVERVQQSIKKRLRNEPAAATLAALQDQLDAFAQIYNYQRPHQGIGRRVPIDRWQASPVAGPASEPLAHPEFGSKTYNCTVGLTGSVKTTDYQIHIGAEHTGRSAVVLIDNTQANVFIDDELVRHLTLDTTRYYQPSGRKRGGPRKPRLGS